MTVILSRFYRTVGRVNDGTAIFRHLGGIVLIRQMKKYKLNNDIKSMGFLVVKPNCGPWCIFELSLSAAAAALWQEILWSICHRKCRKDQTA